MVVEIVSVVYPSLVRMQLYFIRLLDPAMQFRNVTGQISEVNTAGLWHRAQAWVRFNPPSQQGVTCPTGSASTWLSHEGDYSIFMEEPFFTELGIELNEIGANAGAKSTLHAWLTLLCSGCSSDETVLKNCTWEQSYYRMQLEPRSELRSLRSEPSFESHDK